MEEFIMLSGKDDDFLRDGWISGGWEGCWVKFDCDWFPLNKSEPDHILDIDFLWGDNSTGVEADKSKVRALWVLNSCESDKSCFIVFELVNQIQQE